MTTQNKVIAGIVVVLALIVGTFMGFHKNPPNPATAKLGAQIQQEPFWFSNGDQFGPTGTLENWTGDITMGSGQNQVSWHNTTGVTVYTSSIQTMLQEVTGASSTVSVASTTLAIWCGTSTAPTITDSQTGLYGSLIDKVLIATGTPYLVRDGMTNSTLSGSNEQGMVAILNSQYLICVLENPYSAVGLEGAAENATSTARGYNLILDSHYWTL